jgi:hypothetical protein
MHKTKQFRLLLIQLLIMGAAFYFIYNQLAKQRRIGRSSLFYMKNQSITEVVLILLLNVLNHFSKFKIVKSIV